MNDLSLLTGRKTPPHNIELEQALLGAILMDNRAMDAVMQLVSVSDFYEPLHGRIFQTMSDAIVAGRVADYRTLSAAFAGEVVGKGKQAVTVTAYLGRLAVHATSIINAVDYAKGVRELSDNRGLIAVAADATSDAFDLTSGRTAADKIEAAEAALFALSRQGAEEGRSAMFFESATRAVNTILAAYARDTELAGLPTGFRDLDKALGGLAPSDLIIIAGRPGMGKSALAAGIGFNVARKLQRDFEAPADLLPDAPPRRKGEVSFYSLEMSDEQIVMRELAAQTDVPVEGMRRGLGPNSPDTDAKVNRILDALKAGEFLPFHTDSTGAISIAQLSARARRRKRTHDTRLIIVDYLQLMTGGDRGENRVAEVTKITMGLKALAKELNVPIIALSQLSRAVETRPDKRPQLSDLRDSGSIEQDADIVMFVYREEYYLARAEPPMSDASAYADWEAQLVQCEGVAEAIIAKHRHAATGTVYMAFEGKYTRFSDDTGGRNSQRRIAQGGRS